MLKLAELRLLSARWQIASLHRVEQDLVFEYRLEKLAKKLADRSGGRLKVVDEKSIYLRLASGEKNVEDAANLFKLLRQLLRLPNEEL